MARPHRTLSYLPARGRHPRFLRPRLNLWLGVLLAVALFGAAILYATGVWQGGL